MEKYSRVFHFNKPLYLESSPIVILAGAILKDNENDEIIAQVKLKNIVNKKIKAVGIELSLFDSAGEKQKKKVDYEFLDLDVCRNTAFGSKEAIRLPYNNSRSFIITVKKVIFDDGKQWENNGRKQYFALENQDELKSILDLDEINYFKRIYGEKANYVPKKFTDLWMCVCGNINTTDEKICQICNFKEDSINKIDYEKIKKESLYERQKVKKTIRAICIFILLTMIGILAFKTITPNINYLKADKFYKEKKYSEAIKFYEKVGNYKDAKNKLDTAKFKIAIELATEKKFDEAYELIKNIDRSKHKLLSNEFYYMYGNYFIESNPEQAYNIFLGLDSYRDSKEKANIAAKNIAIDYNQRQKYYEAYEWFVKGNDEESGLKILYNYVISHKDKKDKNTYKYLKVMVEKKYSDSEQIYNELY